MIGRIRREDPEFPAALRDRSGEGAPDGLFFLGETGVLRQPLLGLVCSVRCPGGIVLRTFDAARALRDAGVAVIGGFHSPMEKECLDILLRGPQPVVLCPARGLAGMRLGPVPRQVLREGRLLVLSPFAENIRRTTTARAVQRNHRVAALAEALWVPHASPGGKAWTTVHAALARRQPVFTFVNEHNGGLLEAGARPFTELDLAALANR
ncbi:MAG: DNA-processing protein DprA [Acidobacteria bacterium]|nr:DNA-processing protein DprA [Acidobacteriota bacterium]